MWQQLSFMNKLCRTLDPQKSIRTLAVHKKHAFKHHFKCGMQHKSSFLCQNIHSQQSLARIPPVTDFSNIIVLLSFVWISKSLDVQQWSQMIHLDLALMKAVIWDGLYFVFHEPKHDRGSLCHIWYSSRLGGVGMKGILGCCGKFIVHVLPRDSSLSPLFLSNNKTFLEWKT